jgi:ATP-dependent protease HslVU (ClpYQ) peptidase subunit
VWHDDGEGYWTIEGHDGEVGFYDCAADGEVYSYASDEQHKLRRSTADKVIAAIALAPRAAAELFGALEEECSICHHRLTRRESRQRRIGPVCAGRVDDF